MRDTNRASSPTFAIIPAFARRTSGRDADNSSRARCWKTSPEDPRLIEDRGRSHAREISIQHGRRPVSPIFNGAKIVAPRRRRRRRRDGGARRRRAPSARTRKVRVRFSAERAGNFEGNATDRRNRLGRAIFIDTCCYSARWREDARTYVTRRAFYL